MTFSNEKEKAVIISITLVITGVAGIYFFGWIGVLIPVALLAGYWFSQPASVPNWIKIVGQTIKSAWQAVKNAWKWCPIVRFLVGVIIGVFVYFARHYGNTNWGLSSLYGIFAALVVYFIPQIWKKFVMDFLKGVLWDKGLVVFCRYLRRTWKWWPVLRWFLLGPSLAFFSTIFYWSKEWPSFWLMSPAKCAIAGIQFILVWLMIGRWSWCWERIKKFWEFVKKLKEEDRWALALAILFSLVFVISAIKIWDWKLPLAILVLAGLISLSILAYFKRAELKSYLAVPGNTKKVATRLIFITAVVVILATFWRVIIEFSKSNLHWTLFSAAIIVLLYFLIESPGGVAIKKWWIVYVSYAIIAGIIIFSVLREDFFWLVLFLAVAIPLRIGYAILRGWHKRPIKTFITLIIIGGIWQPFFLVLLYFAYYLLH